MTDCENIVNFIFDNLPQVQNSKACLELVERLFNMKRYTNKISLKVNYFSALFLPTFRLETIKLFEYFFGVRDF